MWNCFGERRAYKPHLVKHFDLISDPHDAFDQDSGIDPSLAVMGFGNLAKNRGITLRRMARSIPSSSPSRRVVCTENRERGRQSVIARSERIRVSASSLPSRSLNL